MVLQMATISNEAYAYLLVEDYWENGYKIDLKLTQMKALMMGQTSKRGKEYIIMGGSPRIPMEQDDMEDGQ